MREKIIAVEGGRFESKELNKTKNKKKRTGSRNFSICTTTKKRSSFCICSKMIWEVNILGMNGEARGAHLSGAGRNATFWAQLSPRPNKSVCIMLLRNILIRAVWFAETLRRPFFIFFPPGFTSSSRPYRKFSKEESFSIIFPRRWPLNLFKSKQCVVKWLRLALDERVFVLKVIPGNPIDMSEGGAHRKGETSTEHFFTTQRTTLIEDLLVVLERWEKL